MAGAKVKIGSKEYEIKKFTLGNYPECSNAVAAMGKAGEDRAARAKAVMEFLAAAFGIPMEELPSCPFEEAVEAMGAMVRFNAASPKA